MPGVTMLTLEQTSLEALNLPKQLARILHRNGIRDFGELQKIAEKGDLRKLRFVGKKLSKEISELVGNISDNPNQFIGASENNLNTATHFEENIFKAQN